jgi:DUF1009 family protein
MPPKLEKLSLIAGNGMFPFLVLDAARAQGYEVVVAAIQEEAFPEIESDGAIAAHWLSLGELSKLGPAKSAKLKGQKIRRRTTHLAQCLVPTQIIRRHSAGRAWKARSE